MREKFLVVYILLFIQATIVSCKKSAPSNATSGSVSTSLTSTGSPSGIYNGVFLCSNTLIFPNGATSIVEASFYSAPVSITAVNTIPAGTDTVSSVSLGTVTCAYVPNWQVYYGGSTWAAPAAWSVIGLGSIPSFSYTDADQVPSYGDAYSLPQTIARNQNLLIPVHNLSGADQITFLLSDGNGHSTSVNGGTPVSQIIFSKDSLSKLTAGGGTLEVYATKYNPQTFGGKKFLFILCSRTYINSVTFQ